MAKLVKTKRSEIIGCPWCGCKPSVSEGWGSSAGIGCVWQMSITCESKRCKVSPQLTAHTGYDGYGKEKNILLNNEIIKTWNTRKQKKRKG